MTLGPYAEMFSMRLERLSGAQVKGGVGDVMIGVRAVVRGAPLERRDHLGPRKISRVWQLHIDVTWRSKPVKCVSIKHSVNREEVKKKKNYTLENGQMDWLSESAREKAS